MSLYSHLIQLFTETASINAIIGTGDQARVYPIEIPQAKEFPCLRLFRVSAPRSYTLRGPDGYVNTRMQIDGYAKTLTELDHPASGLMTAVRKKLAGYKGVVAGVPVRSCVLLGEQDFDEPDLYAKRMSFDYSFWHFEEND